MSASPPPRRESESKCAQCGIEHISATTAFQCARLLMSDAELNRRLTEIYSCKDCTRYRAAINEFLGRASRGVIYTEGLHAAMEKRQVRHG